MLEPLIAAALADRRPREHTAPAIFKPEACRTTINRIPPYWLANLNAPLYLISWFVKKPRVTHLNLVHRRATPRRPAFDRYEAVSFGPKTAGQIVRGSRS